ncbi:CCA tRNA nucleotidyltransferase [Bertholletia excelsa]
MRIALNAHRLFSLQSSPLPSFRPFKKLVNASSSSFLSHSISFTCRGGMSTAASRPVVRVRENIVLTDKEKQIFDRLLQVVRHFDLQTQLRVAGGWVRDKVASLCPLLLVFSWDCPCSKVANVTLLGKDCYDIDIAIDNMLGKEFCEKVNEYLSSTGEEAQGVGVIQCNPDQSKHLETARMRLYDLWIDFVNLRSEDYSENSRIPTMRFGTAEEDAYRRDLTINSLFYNINTSSIEDLTGRGIADLKSGKIVTPLPPRETFLDDPLRVLRAIRFGARFEFTLDLELKKAAAADDVKAAIAEKISRERIGHEVDLMVSGNQPVKALACISDLTLFWIVFSLPPEVDPSTYQRADRICVAYVDAAWKLMQLIGCSTFSDEARRLAMYAALLLPLSDTTYKDHKLKTVPVVNYIFRNSLKLKASDAETVMNVHTATKKFVSLIPFITSDDEDQQVVEVDWGRGILDVHVASKLRVLAGLLLREIKDFWRVALLASVLLYPADIDVTKNSSAEQLELEKRKEVFAIIEEEITRLGLDRIWEMKPLLNGKEIMGVLQLKTGGPLVKEWQQKLLEWQLAHPSATSDECLDWMRQAYSKRARVE